MAKTMKLTYFDIRGRAETPRIILTAAGQKFEDERIPLQGVGNWPEWDKIKGDTARFPTAKLPTLTVTENGKTTVIPQSRAIERYLAREFGFYGNSNIEAAQIDSVCEQLNDVIAEFHKHESEDMKIGYLKNMLPAHVAYVERLASQNKGHIIGSKTSLADLRVFAMIDNIHAAGHAAVTETLMSVLSSHLPHIYAAYQTVASHSGIATYIKNRPHRPM